ncbi:TRAP transporter substrate-binding protein [Amorphus orientalis]|uniref:TRAP-type C4-dicarboxylate transport system substrate-binding protein n=1 Tax=Amorphus orientalis TaxID=649198 RepID=A0AAE3VKS5_9HYPH|nr:TRAP transporter substrate-binding protein [Amorphus orientalis]MDQ0313748.1 TRAP-type C4-dicarboxylate transport system substrate-binding protein [Amorphus orientalis]
MTRIAAILGVAAGALLAGQAHAAEYELKVSSMFPSTHFIQTLAMEPWAEEIEKRTDGRVNFTFFPAGSSLGDATRQFDQARNGVADVSVGIPAIPRGRHPRSVLVELPFTVPNSEVGTCAMMKMKDEFAPDYPGTKVLYLTVTEPSAAHTTKEIKTLDDLEGMRIRTPTPAITAMLEEIGATPVGMPPSEIYESVERGVVDGNIMPWGPVGAFKLYEVLDYHLDAGINPVAMYIVFNQRKYDSLPEDIQQTIDEVSEEVFSNWGRWWHETDQEAIEAAKAAGNTVIPMSDAQREEWRERLQPVIENYLSNNSDMSESDAKALYASIREAVKTCE